VKKETVKFDEGIIDIYQMDFFVYFKILNIFNDEMAIEMTRYIDRNIMERPEFSVLVWDLYDVPSESYKITSECTTKIANWSNRIKKKKPGTKSYFIAPELLIYGTARMYELQTGDEAREVVVLKNIEELPKEIRDSIPR